MLPWMVSPSQEALVKLSCCYQGHQGPLTGMRSSFDSWAWYAAKTRNLSQKGMCLLWIEGVGWGGGVFSSCHFPNPAVVVETSYFQQLFSHRGP